MKFVDDDDDDDLSCTCERKEVSDMVKSFVPSTYIGLVRKPDTTNMTNWAPIIR